MHNPHRRKLDIQKLRKAIADGSIGTVKELVKKGLTVTSADLDTAFNARHEQLAKFILDQGVDFQDRFHRSATPCYRADQRSHWQLDLLLQYAKNEHFTPAVIIDLSCEVPYLQLCIDRGLNLDVCDSRGRSPLSLALTAQHYQRTKLLIDAGVNLDVTFEIVLRDGRRTHGNMLHITCVSVTLSPFLPLLLRLNFNPELPAQNGMTPIALATLHKNHSAMIQLIEAGVHLSPQHLLTIAFSQQDLTAASLLVLNGCCMHAFPYNFPSLLVPPVDDALCALLLESSPSTSDVMSLREKVCSHMKWGDLTEEDFAAKIQSLSPMKKHKLL